MKTNFITKGETTPNAFIAKSKQRVKHNNIEHNYGSKNKIFRASRFYLA